MIAYQLISLSLAFYLFVAAASMCGRCQHLEVLQALHFRSRLDPYWIVEVEQCYLHSDATD